MAIVFTALAWFLNLSPLIRYASIALLIASVVGGIYGKGRYDDHLAYTAKLERQAADAVAKANAARTAAENKFDVTPVVPNPKPRHRSLRHPWSVRHDPDGFARD